MAGPKQENDAWNVDGPTCLAQQDSHVMHPRIKHVHSCKETIRQHHPYDNKETYPIYGRADILDFHDYCFGLLVNLGFSFSFLFFLFLNSKV